MSVIPSCFHIFRMIQPLLLHILPENGYPGIKTSILILIRLDTADQTDLRMPVFNEIIKNLHHRLTIINHYRIEPGKIRAGLDKYNRFSPGADPLYCGMSEGSGTDDSVNALQRIPRISKRHCLLPIPLFFKGFLDGETDTQIIRILQLLRRRIRTEHPDLKLLLPLLLDTRLIFKLLCDLKNSLLRLILCIQRLIVIQYTGHGRNRYARFCRNVFYRYHMMPTFILISLYNIA